MTDVKFVAINNEPIMCKPVTKAGCVAPCHVAATQHDYPRAQYKMQARTYMNKHASIFAFCLSFKASPEMIIYYSLISLATVEYTIAENVLTNGKLYSFVCYKEQLLRYVPPSSTFVDFPF
jgi:hypothetical protein